MPRVENLQTGISFITSRDMVRDYTADPLYKVTFNTPQLRVDNNRVEAIKEVTPTSKELKAAIREQVKRRKTEKGYKISPGFTIPNRPRSIEYARGLERRAQPWQ